MNILGEIAACCSFMVLMFLLLVFGSTLVPYQPGMHSEEALQPDFVTQLAETLP